jgi:Na+/alanine symporter
LIYGFQRGAFSNEAGVGPHRSPMRRQRPTNL